VRIGFVPSTWNPHDVALIKSALLLEA